jgi:hypothetical protein
MSRERLDRSRVIDATVDGVKGWRTAMRLGSESGKERVLRFLGCLLVVAVFATGTTMQTSADAEAEALLTASATAMEGVQSYHFVISISTGELFVLDSLELTRAEGDVQRPNSMQATFTGSIEVLPLTANVIIIDEDVWVSVSPLEDRYLQLDLDPVDRLELISTFDPIATILNAIPRIDNSVIVGTEELDGVATTVVEGSVDWTLIDFRTPRRDQVLQPILVRIWVDDANLVRRIQVVDPLSESEPRGFLQQLDLSRFNEPVEIVAPST